MNIEQLREWVNRCDPRHDKNLLVVRLADPSMGPVAMVEVASLGHGFDWENGKVLIYTSEPVCRKTAKKALYDATYDFLFMLSGESRTYKGQERFTPTAQKVREFFERVGRRPRKIGTFLPEEES